MGTRCGICVHRELVIGITRYIAEQERRRAALERKGELLKQFVIPVIFPFCVPWHLSFLFYCPFMPAFRCDQKVLIYTSPIIVFRLQSSMLMSFPDSALEYFRSRNLDTNEDQSRVPKIILAQQQAYEQDEAYDPYEQSYLDPASEVLDSPHPGQYRPELSTITERSEIITEPSPAWPHQSLPRPARRGGADSSRTTSYGEVLRK